MLVKPEDLNTELFPEIVNQITRGDTDEVLLQLKAAEDYVKAYLFKYDLVALFGTEEEEPTHPDENLKKIVKVVATYWLVRKANPNANLELFREDMHLMIGDSRNPGWLINIRDGKSNPGWPYKPDEPGTPENESKIHGSVHFSSNPKRIQSF